jgi:hypothetical protein
MKMVKCISKGSRERVAYVLISTEMNLYHVCWNKEIKLNVMFIHTPVAYSFIVCNSIYEQNILTRGKSFINDQMILGLTEIS